MTKLWNEKQWNNGQCHEDFGTECLDWIMLLLGIATRKLTLPQAPLLLKEFFTLKKSSVVSKYRTQITSEVLMETEKQFPNLTLERFSGLYQLGNIWPLPVRVLHKILCYCVKKYYHCSFFINT